MKEDSLVFADKKQQPSLSLAIQALGEKGPLLEKVLDENDITDTVWKFYSASSGWTLQCKKGKKNLFYIQLTGITFNVWFTLSRQATASILANEQLADVHCALSLAANYTEGTSFGVQVATKKDAGIVAKLAEIKAGK